MANLDSLKYHGLEISGEAGDQFVCDCPFCGKEKHLYVHQTRLVFDCKSCGRRGNADQYLELVAKEAADRMTAKSYRRLSQYRGLPPAAFKGWGIGRLETNEYVIPVRTPKGRLLDLRKFRIGNAVMSTPGCSVGLLGADRMSKDARVPVYVVEGEWDGIALSWALRECGFPGDVIAVPGANTFKREWQPYLSGRDVRICYDNDTPGREGGRKVFNLLRGAASKVRVVHWPEDHEDGYDVRDHIKGRAKDVGAERAIRELQSFLQEIPYPPDDSGPSEELLENPTDVEVVDPVSPSEMYDEFRRWLILEDTSALDIIMGVIWANRIDRSNPVWLLLRALSGGGKSEILSSFRLAEAVLVLTNLTPKALVSGASRSDGEDPSLLPRLDGQTLVIKDFTALMSMPQIARDEIFGILRDAYDGRFVKEFGNGFRREYESHFGIVAGVTPAVDTTSLGGDLGERFLRFSLRSLSEAEQAQIALAALEGASRGQERQEALCRSVAGCLAFDRRDGFPELTADQKHQIVGLAALVAALRVVPGRDLRTGSLMGPPLTEIPTRLSVQLSKLARGTGKHKNESEVTGQVMKLIAQVGLDTAHPVKLAIVRALFLAGSDGVRPKELGPRLRIPQTVVDSHLEVMELQGLTVRVKARKDGTARKGLARNFRDRFATLAVEA